MKTKNSKLYWLFKLLGLAVSCALPLWGIYDKFPIWAENYGTGRSIGTGGIIAIFVILVIFRRTVFNFLKDKWKMKHAPPITIWIVLIICAYAMMFINKFLLDITTVFWMGLIGCGIGGVLTFIGENFFGEEKSNE